MRPPDPLDIQIPSALGAGDRVGGPDEPSVADVMAKLVAIEAKVDDVVARGKKANSLLGMISGRIR